MKLDSACACTATMHGMITMVLAALALAAASPRRPLVASEIAIAVITSSPVQRDRLPAVEASWLGEARGRLAAAVVVSDGGGEGCDGDGCVACACDASHAGIPCKTGCAFEALALAAPAARWHVRAMDDTFVDVDALVWQLDAIDDGSPWYVGDVAEVEGAGFGFALGGCGWALSGPATESSTGRRPAWNIFKPLYLAQIELVFHDS